MFKLYLWRPVVTILVWTLCAAGLANIYLYRRKIVVFVCDSYAIWLSGENVVRSEWREQVQQVMDGVLKGEDGCNRCWWAGNKADYMAYHDNEWGVPVVDDHKLFEKICLEGFQSGLSWLTILRKRENFRLAFSNFEFERVAHYTETDVERLVQDKGIVRHRKKIASVVNNAARAIEVVEEFGSLAAYFWQYEPAEAARPQRCDYDTLSQLSKTPESVAMSKDLKKRGWSFVGPTTAYAFMQSMGMVNDHVEGCEWRSRTEALRTALIRP